MSMFYELMMRKKQQIMYATIKGSLTENDGVFSGFSTSNYLEVQGLYDFSKPFEIKIKIKIGSTPSASSFITVKNNNVGSMIVMVGNGWNIGFYITGSNGNSIANGVYTPNNTLSSNTDYFIKVVFTGTEYDCYVSTDDINYTKNTIATSSNTIGNSCNIKLGANPPNQSFSVGTIDLNKTNIKLGSTKYNLQAVVGYTIVGSPTIVDGVVSGFSGTNYIYLPNIPTYSTFEFQFKVTTPSEYLGNWLFSFITSSSRVYCLSQTPVVRYLSNGSATNLSFNYTVGFNTTYILKWAYDGAKLKTSIYNDSGVLLATNEVEDTTVSLDSGLVRIGSNANTQYFNGSIDLNSTYIKINNKLWFNGQQS